MQDSHSIPSITIWNVLHMLKTEKKTHYRNMFGSKPYLNLEFLEKSLPPKRNLSCFTKIGLYILMSIIF